MVLKRTEMFVFVVGHYACSPRIHLASSMSFGMMVTCLAWMAHRLASSNSLDEVCLCCFLETQYRHRLEPQVCLEILGDLPHQPLKRQLPDEQC